MERINTIVGVIIVFFFTVIITVALVDNLTDAFGKETYKVTGTFTNIGGLTLNSPVQIGGIIIGSVSNIAFTAEGLIHVTLELHMRKPIPVDSVMGIDATLISGDFFINLFRGTAQKMIKRTRHDYEAPVLRTADYYGLADLGATFAKIGNVAGGAVNNIAALVGTDATTMKNIRNIQIHSGEIRDNLAKISARIAAGKTVYGELGDRMVELTAVGDKLVAKGEKIFPVSSRSETKNSAVAGRENIRELSAYFQGIDNKNSLKLIRKNCVEIADWADMCYSPQSVVGVLLADPQHNATATVREIKKAYYSITDRSFVSKVMLALKHYLRARDITGNFVCGNDFSAASLAESYRAWLIHAYQEKSINGYITTGKNR